MTTAACSPPGTPTRNSRGLWTTSLLLFASAVICYIDRSNISVAAPLLKAELGLSVSDLGTVLSAFFWSYAVLQLFSGWLVDRFNVNWILAAGFFLWSAATTATGWVGGFAGLFLLRLLVGIGESVAYPSYAKIFAKYFNEGQRGLANSLIDIGTKCGPALGTLLGGAYMALFGWRPFFIVLGLGALPWLPCWIAWMPRGSGLARPEVGAGPGFAEILAKRSAWATFLGLFCGNYFLYFLLTWLPYYLVHERHFGMESMGYVAALPFLCSAASTACAGWLSYRALAAGAPPTRVRKTCTVLGLSLASVIVMVPVIHDARWAVLVLTLASVSYGIYSSSPWAIAQTIAGPRAAGRWAGIQNFIGNLAGVAASALTGLVAEKTGSFFWAFALTAGVALSGAVVYLLMLGKVEPAEWSYQASS
jgi:ACS family D-galactonate transporter-like MFS transporter